MTIERQPQQQADVHFCRVLRLRPDERVPYMDTHCHADVRREVDELLAFHDKAQKECFLDRHLMELDADVSDSMRTADDTRPDTGEPWPEIPGFELLEGPFPGGMGVVFKVRKQSLPDLPLALKLLRGGWDDESIGRLRREADILAKCQHPNIVQIHDAGEYLGRPYFTMEFVEGKSLGDSPYAKFSPREAASHVRTLAAAVQYAHNRGVLHRDLKPANILVDQPHSGASPALKIADFGLAKRLDQDAGLTATRAVMGTPRYMAWEQATGQNDLVGPATDVYGLGAILYMLLTGEPPIDGRNQAEILGKAADAHHVARAPRSLDPRIAKDLDTICSKCLEKKPELRYQSADALWEDLDRYLADKPISARPAGPIERTTRWCRRNPLASTLIAVLFAGVIGMSLLFARSQHFLNKYEAARQKAFLANVAGAKALFRLGSMEREINSTENAVILFRESAALLESLEPSQMTQDVRIDLAGIYPQLVTALEQLGDETAARETAEYAIVLCEALLDDDPDSGEVRAAAANAFYARAEVFAYQDWPRGYPDYKKAAAYRRELYDTSPTSENQYLLADSIRAVGLANHKGGDTKNVEGAMAAQGYYKEALELIDSALAEKPDEMMYLRLRGRILSNRGMNDRRVFGPGKAIETLHESIQVREALVAKHPAYKLHHKGLAATLTNLADAYRRAERSQEELIPRQQAIDIYKELALNYPSEPTMRDAVATHVVRLAYVLHTLGDDQTAVESLPQVAEVAASLEDGDPNDPAQCYEVAVCYALIAKASGIIPDPDAVRQAVEALRRAFEHEIRLFDIPEYIETFENESAFEVLQGSFEYQSLKHEILKSPED